MADMFSNPNSGVNPFFRAERGNSFAPEGGQPNQFRASGVSSSGTAAAHVAGGGRPQGREANSFLPDEMTSSLAQAGLQQGARAVKSSFQQYIPGLAMLWNNLRFHFMVNNTYVRNKLKLLAWPFRHQNWSRTSGEEQAFNAPLEQEAPPRLPPVEDINCPDLYIPVMAFVTFVVVTGLAKGTRMEFHPDDLSEVTWSSFVTQALEVCVVWFALYLKQVTEVSMLDIIAISSYKYVGLTINLLAGLFFGWWAYYASLVYTGACMVFFMINTLREILPEPELSERRQQNIFLLVASSSQFILMWWLGAGGIV